MTEIIISSENAEENRRVVITFKAITFVQRCINNCLKIILKANVKMTPQNIIRLDFHYLLKRPQIWLKQYFSLNIDTVFSM